MPGFKLALADESAANRSMSNHFGTVVGADTEGQETSVDGLQYRLAPDAYSNSGRRSMYDIDCGAYADFVAFTEGQQRFESGSLHPADHVRRGQHGRQLRLPGAQCMLKFDAPLHLTLRTDGDGF